MNCGIATVQECEEDSRKAVSRSTWAWQPYDQSPPLPCPRDGMVKVLQPLCASLSPSVHGGEWYFLALRDDT